MRYCTSTYGAIKRHYYHAEEKARDDGRRNRGDFVKRHYPDRYKEKKRFTITTGNLASKSIAVIYRQPVVMWQ